MSQSISLDSADLDRPAPPTILIVDDEAVIVEVLALVLEAEGYAVHARTSGRAALEWLRENPADLVLLDFMMPRMDGGAVGHAIRQLPHGSAVAIVISSALPERSVRERFDGYDAFLQKPYDMDVLLKRVAELSRRRSPAG
jgi:CheY-like chemotaxis protein